MPTKESFDIDGLMVFRSDLTAVDQDGNTVASVITPDKYVQSGKEPVSDEQMGRFTNTTAYWNAHSTYVPRKGEVIIYSDGGSITEGGTTVEIPKIKIGDGTTTVVNLPFTDSDTQGGIAGTLDTTNTSSQTPVASESLTGNVNLHKVSKTGDYGDLLNKPQIPTVNNATLTIQKNGTTIDTFTANAATDKTINITVPTTASDVSALPSSTKYAASLSLSIDSSTYVVTAQLKDQDGNNLGSAQTIDLPLESVVVSGSYNAQTKKVVLTLQNGSTIEFSVAYLVAGLQSEITAQNPLSADLIVDGATNKVFTLTMRNKLAGIEEGAEKNVQADWGQDDSDADDFIKRKPDLDATLYESVTYSQLVTKINNSQLVKGRKYRITDYVTTTTQTNTSSAGHAFDLVVTAIDVNELDHRASALLHNGDTYFSTAGADLSKWQVWYDVNNDTTKYAWADATNGKGVIYRMIDEWRNDCPYDFKNILFTKTDAYESAYTFTKTVSSSSPKTDHSLTGECFSNIINDYYKSLGFIVFLCNSQHTVDVYKNYFDIGCHDILSKGTCCYNKLGEDCENILFDFSSYNALAKYCQGVTFGAGCSNNVIEIETFDVVFGSNCFGNVLRGLSETIHLGNSCSNNIIGRGTLTLTFGNSCSANKIGDNSLGISFGNGCAGNVVGYQSYYITLRDYCLRITIASGCASILFGNSSEPSEGGLFCKDITIDEGCQHIRLYNTSSPSASNYLQNIYIAQGVSGTSSSYFEISTIARNLSYRTTVGRDSSGNIRIYNEDDPASASQAQANWNESNSSSPSYIQNKPTIPAAQVNSDWNASSGVAQILNKPNLATVATSGSYNDLSNKPTIPTVPTHRTINHEQITDSTLGDANLHDGFYFPNAVQDYDGNWYGAVVIGDQVWLGENLRTTHYADGTAIAEKTTSAKYTDCYCDYTSSNIPFEKRGYLYNWQATTRGMGSNTVPSGVQGIAPTGWHIPSEGEWNNLSTYLNKQKRYRYNDADNSYAKSVASTNYWNASNVVGAAGYNLPTNNASLLNFIPAGSCYNGEIGNTNVSATFYCTASASSYVAKYIYFINDDTSFTTSNYNKRGFCSVRCVSNLTPIQFRDWYVNTYGTLQHNIHPMEDLSDVVYDYEFKYIPNVLTDYDGNSYGAVIIGNKVWMADNLRTTHYADGTAITLGTGNSDSPRYYNNTNSIIPLEKRGYLYNYFAFAKGSSSSNTNPSGMQGVAPTDWHIPSDLEFLEMENRVASALGGNQISPENDTFGFRFEDVNSAKALAQKDYWLTSAVDDSPGEEPSLNNFSQFGCVPTGRTVNAIFSNEGEYMALWTCSSSGSDKIRRIIQYNYKGINRSATAHANTVMGYTVRCVYNGTPEQFIKMLMDKQVLVYDYSKQAWVNKNVAEALPSMSGNSGKVLAVNDTETDVEWVSTQECMWYGVRKDRSNDSTTLERIGNLEMHKTLPIQSKMRRCLLLDNGTVNYYLSDTDSTKKEDGVTAAVLDGTDGQVMVEIPAHYQRFDIYTDEVTGHEIEERKISEVALPGFEYVPARYYSAFEAALNRTNNKLSSVINTTAQYRGGNNKSDWDNTYRSLLGMPATNFANTYARTYAHNRGNRWTSTDINIYEDICDLYLIEYANTNCQLAFDSTLTAEGYKQGGLGRGVTRMPSWNAYNTQNPIIPCGVTTSLGNSSGTVTHNVMASDGTTVTYAAPVPSYRGIENLFGHLWNYVDGIIVRAQSEASGGKHLVYKCTDPTKFSDSITSDYKYIGDAARTTTGTVKTLIAKSVVASSVGSGGGYADRYTTSVPSSGTAVRAVLVGDCSTAGDFAGIFATSTSSGIYSTLTYQGYRLCYTPMTVELPPLEGNSGKVLAVNSGETGVEWARPVTVYSGSSEPSASLGEDGDIYILAS